MANIPLTIPTPLDLRNQYLRVVRNGLIKRGVPSPNVTDNSDYAVKADALAQQLSIAIAQQPTIVDALMPDTAIGDQLTRWMTVFGLAPRPAQGSSGPITYSASASGLVGAGAQLYDDQGQVWQVAVGATYSSGDIVAIEPVPGLTNSTGKTTNRNAGTVLQWVTPPPFAAPTAVVATGGLKGGTDVDTEETSRRRLLARMKNAAGGGNWPQVQGWAEQASSSVDAAYVYPALDGPSALGLCVLGQLTYDATLGFTREVSTITLAQVAAYVAGQLPEHANLTTQTPADVVSGSPAVTTRVSIGLSLPAAADASPPGPGGGWANGVPWPDRLGVATRVIVQSVSSGTSFVLTADGAAPSAVGVVAGVTKIAWFDAAGFAAGGAAIRIGTVTAVAGSAGALSVTLDASTPFPNVQPGDLVFPAAENVEAYAQAWLAALADMGPGQWTSDVSRLPRAYRQPLVSQSNPSDLGASQLRAITNSGDEVLDIQYLFKSVTSPGVPANTTQSPKVIVPDSFGFYPL